MAKFILYKDVAGKFRWRLWSDRNNKTVADSAESYESKDGAKNGIDWVKNNAHGASVENTTFTW